MIAPAIPIRIAIVGQPNVGKSTVFNLLTGLDQYVSNWPGKTCDQRAGTYHSSEVDVQVTDLPGTYSLTSNSLEERISRNHIIQEKPDLLVVVVDAVSLERNLYLVAELLCLEVPLIIALNRLDLAAQQGIQIEPHVLAAALDLPVIPMVASRGQGGEELIDAVLCTIRTQDDWHPNLPEVREDHKAVLDAILDWIKDDVPAPYSAYWVALKLLEGDREITQMVQAQLGPRWDQVQDLLAQHEDAFMAVASGRYEWIARMIRAAVVKPRVGQLTLTDRVDRAATHPVFGLLILLAILGGLFWLTFSLGTPVQVWMDTQIVQALAEWARSALAGSPGWVSGLVADGLITGVGTVLTLLPILLVFFTVLGVLEDIGYMSRAAYVMDRLMHLMGLHGKSFLPIFLGFGCNVPAVMGTRLIESTRDRLITILVTPLVPCTARLSVIALLAPVFFGSSAAWVSLWLVCLSLGFVILAGIAAHHTLKGAEQNVFIMELPLYQLPDFHAIRQGLWQRLWDFLKMAGSIILVVSVLMWFLSTYPGGSIDGSYLATLGQWLSPVGKWMGFDWRMVVALLTSFVRKENTIPTLAVLYGASGHGTGMAQALANSVSPASGLAFLTVQILFIPCVATLATIRQETSSWRWTVFSVLFLLAISVLMGVMTFRMAVWFGG